MISNVSSTCEDQTETTQHLTFTAVMLCREQEVNCAWSRRYHTGHEHLAGHENLVDHEIMYLDLFIILSIEKEIYTEEHVTLLDSGNEGWTMIRS